MRKIDMESMRIVHLGKEWPYPIPPHHKSMTPYLEKNERLVYWLEPDRKDASVEDQVPALKLADGFYSLSLRIMKCIYRNIRLKKGFRNIESAQLGGYKLRIPKILLSEKTRTQARFSTMRTTSRKTEKAAAAAAAAAAAEPPDPPAQAPVRAPLTAASKVTNVVFEFFLPVADGYFPRYTPFTMTPDVEEQEILEKISDIFPECMNSRTTFVDTVGGIYDRGVTSQGESHPPATDPA